MKALSMEKERCELLESSLVVAEDKASTNL